MRTMIELSPRLAMAAGMVPWGARLADIGTDHAYLPAALVLSGRIPCAIAADLRSGPLERAEKTVKEFNLTDKIQLRLCDGLRGIRPHETDAVVIAGMGGETIAAILGAAPWLRAGDVPLILQPMSSMYDLRRWLGEHGFRIEREELCREGETLYTAWLVRPGEAGAMSETELWVGRNSPHPLRGGWLALWQGKLRRAMEGLSRSRLEDAAARRAQLAEVDAGLTEMREEWEKWQ